VTADDNDDDSDDDWPSSSVLEDPSKMMLFLDRQQPISIPIQKALRWLEYTRNHILPILLSSLERSKKQLQVADATVQHRQQIVQQLYRMTCYDSSSTAAGTTTCAAAAYSSTATTTSETESTTTTGVAFWTTTRRSFLMEVLTNYSHHKTKEGDPLEIFSTLLELSSDDEEKEHNWDEGNVLQSIEMALVEWIAFVKCRRALPATIPSLQHLVTVFIDDDDDDQQQQQQHPTTTTKRLEEWEQQQLQAIIDHVVMVEARRTRQQLTFHQNDDEELASHQHHHMKRWQESKERLVQAEQALRQAKDLVVVKEEELAAVRRSVMSIKQKVEEEIVALLKLGDHDPPICIEVM
jgi:hypothetical protein